MSSEQKAKRPNGARMTKTEARQQPVLIIWNNVENVRPVSPEDNPVFVGRSEIFLVSGQHFQVAETITEIVTRLEEAVNLRLSTNFT